eukprot:TRINITY_DN16936_c0_g1_i1.p1 TRINITY_DN16936_c0_g1~~TRINITY_DN16936_c0_g1_i1.p1  ORF type:complete len:112 (+),score=4.89 TRINITY_DN16936_c0_g1_i1:50-337(+)
MIVDFTYEKKHQFLTHLSLKLHSVAGNCSNFARIFFEFAHSSFKIARFFSNFFTNSPISPIFPSNLPIFFSNFAQNRPISSIFGPKSPQLPQFLL